METTKPSFSNGASPCLRQPRWPKRSDTTLLRLLGCQSQPISEACPEGHILDQQIGAGEGASLQLMTVAVRLETSGEFGDV